MRTLQAVFAVLPRFATLALWVAAGSVLSLVPGTVWAAESGQPVLAINSPATPALNAADVPASPAIPEPKGSPPPGEDTPPPFMQHKTHGTYRARPDLTFALKPAPTQFRGLPWGISLEKAREQFADLTPVEKPVPLPGTYSRPGELLKLGEADLRSVAYYFHKGALTGAGIMFEGEANFFLIKEHLIALYGPGRQVGDRYGWTWNTFSIDLRMRGQVGELRYNSYAP